MYQDAVALSIGFAMVFVPLVLGAALGGILRRRRPARRWKTWIALIGLNAAIVGATIVVVQRLLTVGVWDIVSEGAMFAGALTFAAVTPSKLWRPRRLIALVVVCLVPLCVLDLGLRFGDTQPPIYPPPRDATLTFRVTNRDPPCLALFPEEDSKFFEYQTRPKSGLRVLHVGDSMVFGLGMRPEEVFPARLARLEPGVEHINPSQPGTGPDTNLLIAQKWQTQTQADHVLFYFFVGNDLFDLNRVHLCCNETPLLDFSEDPPKVLCEEEHWKISFGALLTSSPPPYPLRVAAHWSTLAAYGAQAYAIASARLQESAAFRVPWRPPPRSLETQFGQTAQLFRALRTSMQARGVRVTVVVIPWRRTLQLLLKEDSSRPHRKDPALGAEPHRRVVDLARAADLDVIDLLDPLLQGTQDQGIDALFNNAYRDDVHFSAEGHAWMARFLDGELKKRGIYGRSAEAAPGQ